MNIKLASVEERKRIVLRNLVKMYCYEWSQYNGIDIDQNGDYAFEHDLDRFFIKDKHHAYFIMVKENIVGFVLVDTDIDYYKESDYAISEFFVLNKYRKLGIGKQAAIEVFKQHRGKWEIKMHPKNKGSIEFWKRVVEEISKDRKYDIKEECKEAKYNDGSLGTFIGFETAD